jgi:hypothetical protein
MFADLHYLLQIIDYIGKIIASANAGVIIARPGWATILQKKEADDAIQATTNSSLRCVDGAVAHG